MKYVIKWTPHLNVWTVVSLEGGAWEVVERFTHLADAGWYVQSKAET